MSMVTQGLPWRAKRPRKTQAQRETMLPPRKEALFQEAVIGLARILGWHLIYHTHDSRRSESGFPDLIMIRGDRLVAAELKARKGRQPDDAQQAWLDGFALVKRVDSYLWRDGGDLRPIADVLK